MKFGADSLPDDLVLLKALILQLQEENALLRHKLFSPKSERSPEEADSPQLAMLSCLVRCSSRSERSPDNKRPTFIYGQARPPQMIRSDRTKPVL
nr:hypothetical protein [Stutzerimonas nitrititolerans]